MPDLHSSLGEIRRGVKGRVRKARSVASLHLPAGSSIGAENLNSDSPVVVSMTTFPARFGNLWKTLHSLSRQTIKPDIFLLVVADKDYIEAKNTESIAFFLKRGVELIGDDGDRRSYKKLLPAMELFPSATIVTADDDVLYPRRWLAELLAAEPKHRGRTVGHRATEMLIQHGKVSPYISWPTVTFSTAPKLVFLTGMGGILYPPNCLHPDVADWDLASRICPTADDIWFKIMALRNSTFSNRIGSSGGDFPVSESSTIENLTSLNVSSGRNDDQLAACLQAFGSDILL